MKKGLVIIAVAAMVLAGLTPVLAAAYYFTIEVLSPTTSYTAVPLIVSINNTSLVDTAMISSTGLDTRVVDNDVEVPHMVADDKLLFAADVPAGNIKNIQYTTGNSLLSAFAVLTGHDGYITVADNDSLEAWDNFSINMTGYFDTSATIASANNTAVGKENSISVNCSSSGNLDATVWSDDGSPVESALYYDGYIYCGMAGGAYASAGSILKVNATTLEVEDTILVGSTQCYVMALVRDGDNLYAGLSMNPSPAAVVRIDLNTFTQTGLITMDPAEGNKEMGVCIGGLASDGTNLYAMCGNFGTISNIVKIDLTAFSRVTHTSSVNLTNGRALLIDGTNMYALNTQTGRLGRIDLTTFSFTGDLDIDGSPEDIACDSNYLYISHIAGSTAPISRIDKATLALVDTLELNTDPFSYISGASGLLIVGTDMYVGLQATGTPDRVMSKVDLTTFTESDNVTDSVAADSWIRDIMTDGSGTIFAPCYWDEYVFYEIDMTTFTITAPSVEKNWGVFPITISGAVANGIHNAVVSHAGNNTLFKLDVDGVTLASVNCSMWANANANDWYLMYGNVITYLTDFRYSVDGVLQLHYLPTSYIVGTTLPDSEGTVNNGVITWGSNPGSVTAIITGGAPGETPVPPTIPSGGGGIIDEVPDQPEGLYTEGGYDFPGGPELVAMGAAADPSMPKEAVLFPMVFFTAIALGMGTFAVSHKAKIGVKGSLLLMVTVIEAVLLFFYAGTHTIPGWVLIPGGLFAIVLLMWRNPYSPAA